jgi:Fusaric acid resistance protein-like
VPESLARTTLRRAGRATLVACGVFYVFRYGLGEPMAATYGLFGAVALGAFAQVSGAPAVRVRTLLTALPVGWLLVTAGTLLAGWDVAAALGMLVLGFLVSYAGVGGPRVAGVVNGLQLLYILACFPPYAPGTLPGRLLGLTTAVLALALAELVLWPGPVPERYERRLGAAVAALGGRLRDESDALVGRGTDRGASAPTGVAAVAEQMDGLKPSRLPSELRPASAGRRDTALAHATGTARYTAARAADLVATDVTAPDPTATDPAGRGLRAAAGVLLGRTADAVDRAAAWLSRGGPAPDAGLIPQAITEFRATRTSTPPGGLHPDQLRLGSIALSVADGAAVMVTALRIASGAPTTAALTAVPAATVTTVPAMDVPVPTVQSGSGSFWYANRSSPALWWHRLREHLTPRSVYFQGALRLALALAFARLLAGVLDLAHGFWVLLATLTVLRASAAATRAVLWPSLVGTVIGAGLAGLLLSLVSGPTFYVVMLPVLMLVGFAAGPLLGQVVGQALFTLVIATVFAQLEPPGWQLAEVRLLDVALGGAIGVLIGLCAWPRGGAGEMHRASGNFLADCAASIRITVAALTGSPPEVGPDPAPNQGRATPGRAVPARGPVSATAEPVAADTAGDHAAAHHNLAGPALGRPSAAEQLALTRHDGQLADASFGLYQSETRRLYAPSLDWQATLVAGHHVVRGAEGLLRSCQPGRLTDVGPLGTTSSSVAAGYDAVAAQLLTRRPVDVPPVVRGPQDQDWPADLGPDLYHLADLRVWLDGVAADLTRIHP